MWSGHVGRKMILRDRKWFSSLYGNPELEIEVDILQLFKKPDFLLLMEYWGQVLSKNTQLKYDLSLIIIQMT